VNINWEYEKGIRAMKSRHQDGITMDCDGHRLLSCAKVSEETLVPVGSDIEARANDLISGSVLGESSATIAADLILRTRFCRFAGRDSSSLSAAA